MQRISITNPQNIIDGTVKKYYFKLRNTGGPKGDKGEKGDTGQTGPQGPQGNAATVSVGSTTTLPVGQDATVENVGSIYNAVLNFGIPQGPRGPQGATGATGAKGDKGDQGNPGPQGEKGTNATVYIGTTSTLNPGSQATVYNSGTDSNAVLNFGIPKGEKGDTGPMPTIAQTTGQAIDQVMSQKATTDALNTKQATISSSNKLSADLVDDTSTTNKFVTASDITNWNGKQDALTAGTGIDITGGVISTPAIVPEVVTELPTAGEEGKLYLTPKAHTTSTATGNPITASVAEEAGKIESFQLDGDTFQQTYSGKNLYYDADGYTQGFIGGNGEIASSAESVSNATYIEASENTQYVMSFNDLYGGITLRGVGCYDSNKHFISRITSTEITDGAFQTVTGTAYIRVYFYNANGLDATNFPTNYISDIQLELGSTPTSGYEPYTGGQPSPSPEYPQPIQTVTGLQTITINGTDYPLDLGSIELCGLGDDGNGNPLYKDRIYQDGEEWKVHKVTAKITLDGSSDEVWTYNGDDGSTSQFRLSTSIGAVATGYNSIDAFASHFVGDVNGATATVPCFWLNQQGLLRFRVYQSTAHSLAEFKTWLGTALPSVYFEIATPTDTIITDTDLIAQLEAIRTASLENGTNTITNTATGTNLAGDMKIGYYGYNPTNRYDKWLWLDLNNNYEKLGS